VQSVGINVKDNDVAARTFERRFKISHPIDHHGRLRCSGSIHYYCH